MTRTAAEPKLSRTRPAKGFTPAGMRPSPAIAGSATETTTLPKPTAPFLVLLFFISLLPPIYFFLGDMRLSPSRIFLILMFLPLLARLLMGSAGRVMAMDIFMMLYAAWIMISLFFHHGLERVPLAGISVVELLGAYLLGRVLICNETDYRRFLRYFLYTLLFMLPFAVVELMTNRNLLQEVFRPFVGTYFKGSSSYGRLGLNRVMASLEHPILYGLYCATGISTFYFAQRRPPLKGLLGAGFATFMTFMSLSSGPLLGAATQFGIIAWGKLTKANWKLLVILTVCSYVVVDALSNRTPITILISYVTFDPTTAWMRIATWKYGTEELWRNPIFGIGLNDWERPEWLTDSVDNFWLLNAMRYGLPGIGFLAAALGFAFRDIARSDVPSNTWRDLRTGYLIAMVGLFVSLCTVHVWGNTSSFVFFFFGAGAWLVSPVEAKPAPIASRAVAETPRHSTADASVKRGASGLGDRRSPLAVPMAKRERRPLE